MKIRYRHKKFQDSFSAEQVIGALDTRDVYFWATHAGAELDLLVAHKGRRHGFKFKYADAPGIGRSMRIAVQDLSLDHLWVVHPGRQPGQAGIRARPAGHLDPCRGRFHGCAPSPIGRLFADRLLGEEATRERTAGLHNILCTRTGFSAFFHRLILGSRPFQTSIDTALSIPRSSHKPHNRIIFQ